MLKRQRELPFGTKLQNHALNSRLNDEFRKFYPTLGKPPLVRDITTQRYWLQEDLLHVQVRHTDGTDHTYNIAPAVLAIIDAYVATKQAAFETFLETCRQMAEIGSQDAAQAVEFIIGQLQPNVDARIFEIISFAILKAKYGKESIWLGTSKESVTETGLVLFKTGRTNANDGGIDFVMKPLGRFFQVTETTDVSKYFLDIDKVQRYPITFVVKSMNTSSQIWAAIQAQAAAKYRIDTVVAAYMKAIEGIINIPDLVMAFEDVTNTGGLTEVMNEIMIQSKVEFNYQDSESP